MARLPRMVVPGQVLHIVQRGNNRQATFYADEDYQYYLESLAMSAAKYGCAIHAYVLMTNHVHLLLTPAIESSPSKMMQALGRRYVRYINAQYRRTGTLWEGRYKSALIDSEQYLLTCYRYIELNPVRAGMVSQSLDYPWSSYAHNALGKPNSVITSHELYIGLAATANKRYQAYRDLFSSSHDGNDIAALRKATTSEIVMGSDRFQEDISKHLNRRVTKLTHGGDRRSRAFDKRR